MALLEVRQLVKKFGPRKVVDGVSFEVNPGEVVGLLGPNGAGKTTSFRMATGQITPNEGDVWFNGQDVTLLPMYQRARKGMGYLSQEPSIFRKLTVEKNILSILEALPSSRTLGRKLTRSERWERTERVLAQFKLEAVRTNQAARCSGGEKRRLEIARCLVCEPLLILLDEPLAAVDPLTKEDIRRNIRDLANQGIGILLTDHDVREVMKIADRAYVIIEGKVVATGTPEELKRNKLAVDGYLGSTFEDEVARNPVYNPYMQAPPVRVPQVPHDAALTPLTYAAPAPFAPPRPAEPAPQPAPLPSEPHYQQQVQPQYEPPTQPQYQQPVQPQYEPLPQSLPVQHSPAPPIILTPQAIDPIADMEPFEPLPPPPPRPQPVAGAFPLFAPSGPGQFSGVAQQVLEQEKMRRLVNGLNDEAEWANSWHELTLKGQDAVPILLEGLERREPKIRHLAFRLLEQITGEQLNFDSQAPDEIRFRQVAHLRARLEWRRSA